MRDGSEKRCNAEDERRAGAQKSKPRAQRKESAGTSHTSTSHLVELAVVVRVWAEVPRLHLVLTEEYSLDVFDLNGEKQGCVRSDAR